MVDVVDCELAVACKSVHSLTDHAESLLDRFLEGAAYGHNFADRFHRRADLAAHAVELAEIPARNFADDIVEGRLEESRCLLGHGILEIEEPVAESELGGHECQRIAGGLRCQCRRAAQSGVDLDHAVFHRGGIEGILYVTLAYDADMTYDFYREFTQVVVVFVGKGLRGSYDD